MPKKQELKESQATFKGIIRAASEEDLKQTGLSKASMLSTASSLIPETLDTEKSLDVLPVFFNLGVVNKFNSNGDGIDAISAAKLIKHFIHKPLNIEHYKTDIVGHIINASFSDKQPDPFENDITDFLDRKDPFFINVAAVIYRHVYPELAEAIEEATDPNSPWYQAYSSSWEVGFSDFAIAVGEKELQNCTIYSSSSELFPAYKDNLQFFGGSGNSKDGTVNRLLSGDMLALGAAITETPAAEVSGVYTLESIMNRNKKSYASKKTSQSKEKDVINKNDNTEFMTDEQFKEFTALIKSLKQDDNESNASVSQDAIAKIEKVLKDSGEGWKSQADKSKEELEKIQGELSKAKEDLKANKEEFDKVKQDLEVKEQAEKLNARMASIANTFVLEEDEEKIVSAEVKDLQSDEDFEKYFAKARVIFKHRTKEAIEAEKNKSEASNKEEGEKEEENNKEDEEKEIESSEANKKSVLNNNGDNSDNETLFDRVRKNGLQLQGKE